ncbi:MAG: hypothetical protein U0694_20915 [Anaerolineae bacterium]
MQALLLSSALTLGCEVRTLLAIFSPLLTDIPIIIVCVFLPGQLPPQFITLIQFVGIVGGIWRGAPIRAGAEAILSAPGTARRRKRRATAARRDDELPQPRPVSVLVTD